MICDELGIKPQDNGVKGMGGDGNVQVKTVGLRGIYVGPQGELEVCVHARLLLPPNC